MEERKIVVRPYRAEDHDQVQGVCVGASDDPMFQSEQMKKLMLTAFCDYYIEQEPENCFVAAEGDRVAGYILCAENSKQWAEDFTRLYVPDLENNPAKVFFDGIMASPLKYADTYPAHLHIDLLPKYQRQGLGTRLMDALIAHLKEKGIPGVMLGVARDNEKGQNFYRKYGFSVVEEAEGETVMAMLF